jgi:hypothetical protein
MWFGNLVTMEWFNDVWTKEVFANFMAAKIVNPQFPDINHDLNFLVRHYPGAYSVDRTAGANAIRQALPNLNEAGTGSVRAYGNTWRRSPSAMRPGPRSSRSWTGNPPRTCVPGAKPGSTRPAATPSRRNGTRARKAKRDRSATAWCPPTSPIWSLRTKWFVPPR